MKNKYLRKSINLLSILIVGLFLNACSFFGTNPELTENAVRIIAEQGGFSQYMKVNAKLIHPVPVGIPDEDPAPRPRLSLDEIAFSEKYGGKYI